MNLNLPPKQISIDIAGRSSCSVQVGACLVDRKGRIFSVGWNHQGHDGYGSCAEQHCLTRANRNRVKGSTIFIAGFRARSNNPVTSKPCVNCGRLLRWSGIDRAVYLTKTNDWMEWNA